MALYKYFIAWSIVVCGSKTIEYLMNCREHNTDIKLLIKNISITFLILGAKIAIISGFQYTFSTLGVLTFGTTGTPSVDTIITK